MVKKEILKSSLGACTPWHTGVAAEAFAAAQFARCGYDVSVQYGANQPEYDLAIIRGDKFLKVSVKGSQEGWWGLTQNYLAKADYHKAVDDWLEHHNPKTIFCLVQLKNIAIDELPRIYLATPKEVGARLKATAKGRGDTILYEEKEWTKRAHGFGTTDRIPASWKFSGQRVVELIGGL